MSEYNAANHLPESYDYGDLIEENVEDKVTVDLNRT